jgi:glycosyltransferase involved in cell wall biosynthesis
MKFSIIIPTFNSVQYLWDCIQSVLQQDYTDYEILVVDDGSTDTTHELCAGLTKKHLNFRYIYQNNVGPSGARNNGIRHATGKYLLFLDADDVWEGTTVLSELSKQLLTEPDVVIFGYKKADGEMNNQINRTVFSNLIVNESDQELLQMAVKEGLYTSAAWLKCVNKEFIEDNRLFFAEGKQVEDITWCLKIAIYARSIEVYPQSFYIYRFVSGSRSNTCSRQKLDDYYEAIEEGTELIKNSDREYLYHYLAYQYCILLGMAADQQDLRQKLRQFTWLLNYDAQKKVRLVHQSVRIIGYNNTCRLLKKYLH